MNRGATSPPSVELRDVTKRFLSPTGEVFTALEHLDLTVAPGEFCTVVGPTGCGKSTTLGLVSGLQEPTAGAALVDGKPVAGIRHDVGFVFQHDALFPWKSAEANVAAGPLFRGRSKREARQIAMEWLGRVGLSEFARHYPHQLSGGMRKRVSLAQSFANEPRILLMDEPFSALDVQTRQLMSDLLLELWSTSKATVLFVTHDLEEAIALADKVVVMTTRPASAKRAYQVDLPRPRRVEDIRMEPRFMAIYRQIWESLRDEVHRVRLAEAGAIDVYGSDQYAVAAPSGVAS
jgi:NitT/TauT family transport system ATP-binding protein